MALTYSAKEELGRVAADFKLLGTDDRIHQLSDFNNSKALLVIFMCNHCPYVISVQGRINALAKDFASSGLSIVGINSNDTVSYPDDDLNSMKQRAKEQGYVFPYLLDDSQEIAKKYGAACTPDPFLYERVGNQFLLRYHGRIDDNWKDERAVKKRDLAQAVDAILRGKPIPVDQVSSMGCNIKWREK